LKLEYDEALSNCAFNFNLRRYSVEGDCLFITNVAAATADATESQDADDRSHMAGSAHSVTGLRGTCHAVVIDIPGQPKWMSGSEQHLGWIRGGAGGESDQRVGLNRMGKMAPQYKP